MVVSSSLESLVDDEVRARRDAWMSVVKVVLASALFAVVLVVAGMVGEVVINAESARR